MVLSIERDILRPNNNIPNERMMRKRRPPHLPEARLKMKHAHLGKQGNHSVPHLPETKIKIKKALIGRPKSAEHIRAFSTVWARIQPLAMRGLAAWEIKEIVRSTFTRKQIKSAIRNHKDEIKKSPFLHTPNEHSDPQKTRERQIKGSARFNQKRFMGNKEGEDNNILFVRKLWESGLIKENPSVWLGLNRLYRFHKIALPADNFDRLRLEVYLEAAKELEFENKPEKLAFYKKLGYEVGYEWFITSLLRDERFIRNYMFSNGTDVAKRERIREMVEHKKNAEEYCSTYSNNHPPRLRENFFRTSPSY
ncbi:MAG: hypothetical protein HW400_58 [Candidatus Levybacteria bacterium]|nr:hypothetical protein [Candidatus Levybacteria bacterium]